jgi:hypothetical protein
MADGSGLLDKLHLLNYEKEMIEKYITLVTLGEISLL